MLKKRLKQALSLFLIPLIVCGSITYTPKAKASANFILSNGTQYNCDIYTDGRDTSLLSSTNYYNELKDSDGRTEAAIYTIDYTISGNASRKTYFSGDSNNYKGGFELLLKVGDTQKWLGTSNYNNSNGSVNKTKCMAVDGIELKTISFAAINDSFIQVNFDITNNSGATKTFSLATTGDIEVAGDDNADVEWKNNGFIMSNRYAETCQALGGTIESTSLRVYTSGNPYVTDASNVWVGYFTDRKNHAFSGGGLYDVEGFQQTTINDTRHGTTHGASGFTDTGFAISWNDKKLGSGESIRLSYIIGIGEIKTDYDLTLDPNGGTFLSDNSTSAKFMTSTYKLMYNSSNWYDVAGAKAARANYTFDGWWTSPTGGIQVYGANGLCINGTGFWENNIYIGTESLYLYAHWIPNVYQITLNKNGGTGGTDYFYEKYGKGYYSDAACTKLLVNNKGTQDYINIPTKSDSKFLGYEKSSGISYIDSSGKVELNDSPYKEFVSDMTLYAKWEQDTITFNANGGKFSDSSTTKTKYTYYGDKTSLNSSYIPTREGYEFMGWYADKYTSDYTKVFDSGLALQSKAYTSSAKTVLLTSNTSPVTWVYGNGVNNTITLYAKWIPKSSGVKLLTNGGTWNSYFVSGDGSWTIKKVQYNSSEYFQVQITETGRSNYTNNSLNVYGYFRDENNEEEEYFDLWFTIDSTGTATPNSDDGDYPTGTIFDSTTQAIYIPCEEIARLVGSSYGILELTDRTWADNRNYSPGNNYNRVYTIWNTDESLTEMRVYSAANWVWAINHPGIAYEGCIFAGFNIENANNYDDDGKILEFIPIENGTTIVSAQWNTKYIVRHYIQGIDSKYTLHSSTSGINALGEEVSPPLSSSISSTIYNLPSIKTVVLAEGNNYIDYYYSRKTVPYTVRHWYQNADGTYTTHSDDSDVVLYGGSVTPELKYDATKYKAPEQQTISNITSATTIDYYYPRKTYTVVLNKDAGITSVTGANSYRWGEEVDINAVVYGKCNWDKWVSSGEVINE